MMDIEKIKARIESRVAKEKEVKQNASYEQILKAYMLEVYKWRGEFLDNEFYYENSKIFSKLKEEILLETRNLSENIVDCKSI